MVLMRAKPLSKSCFFNNDYRPTHRRAQYCPLFFGSAQKARADGTKPATFSLSLSILAAVPTRVILMRARVRSKMPLIGALRCGNRSLSAPYVSLAALAPAPRAQIGPAESGNPELNNPLGSPSLGLTFSTLHAPHQLRNAHLKSSCQHF
jgi:hypothetical protein